MNLIRLLSNHGLLYNWKWLNFVIITLQVISRMIFNWLIVKNLYNRILKSNLTCETLSNEIQWDLERQCIHPRIPSIWINQKYDSIWTAHFQMISMVFSNIHFFTLKSITIFAFKPQMLVFFLKKFVEIIRTLSWVESLSFVSLMLVIMLELEAKSNSIALSWCSCEMCMIVHPTRQWL